MKASEIPIGSSFVGHVDREDWWLQDNRHFDGSLITVVAVFPGPTGELTEKMVMNLFAGLRADNPDQLSSELALWVVGVRAKRSKSVRVFDWQSRCSVFAAEKVCEEMVGKSGGAK